MRRLLRFALATAAIPLGIACHPDKVTARLSPVENALVGLWSRYRSSNSRTEYILFKSDRSACYFEIGNANWSKLVYKDWPSWSVDEAHPVGAAEYIVNIPASGLTSGYTFDYGGNTLYPTSASLVVYSPDNGTNAALACTP